jgi:hypothetical protein
MGVTTGLLIIEKATAKHVQSAIDVMVLAKKVVKFEEATRKYAVGVVDGWAVFWDNDIHRKKGDTAIGRELIRTLAAHGRMLALSMAPFEPLFAFTWYLKKKVARSVTYREGEIVAETGEALIEEQGIDPAPGETFLWTLTERLTGISLGMLQAGRYTVLKPG